MIRVFGCNYQIIVLLYNNISFMLIEKKTRSSLMLYVLMLHVSLIIKHSVFDELTVSTLSFVTLELGVWHHLAVRHPLITWILPCLVLFWSRPLTERSVLEIVDEEVRGTHQGQEDMAAKMKTVILNINGCQ